jgi:prepilin-type N-terminal cleavage/methylation domain-containing protein
MQRAKREQKGFTLLEILLVIATIGILAAIVIIAINPTRQISQARNAERRSEINSIYKALEQYLIETGSYPVGITSTVLQDICNTGNNGVGQGTVGSNCIDLRVLVPDYIAGIPGDPATGSYRVSKNEENNRIRVTATKAELGQVITVNPAVEERLQIQIAEEA